jgi:hypothetical protein
MIPIFLYSTKEQHSSEETEECSGMKQRTKECKKMKFILKGNEKSETIMNKYKENNLHLLKDLKLPQVHCLFTTVKSKETEYLLHEFRNRSDCCSMFFLKC